MKAVDRVERNIHYHCLEYDHEQPGDIFLVACGVEQCDPGVTYGPDVRDCFHLHIVKSGAGVLRVRGMQFDIHAGQMFLLKHNEEVSYTADPDNPWSYCWVTFNGSEAKQLSLDIGFLENIYVRDLRKDPEEFYALITRMHQRPEFTYINDLFRRGVLLEFLSLAMEASEEGAEAVNRRYQKPVDEYIQKAIDFMNYNYATIQVGDVIQFIGFSRGYFSTAFRKKTGVSLQDYLTRIRMKRAKKLLRETDLRIQEVAVAVGYEDQLNFSRMFRRNEEISPSDYRKRFGNEPG